VVFPTPQGVPLLDSRFEKRHFLYFTQALSLSRPRVLRVILFVLSSRQIRVVPLARGYSYTENDMTRHDVNMTSDRTSYAWPMQAGGYLILIRALGCLLSCMSHHMVLYIYIYIHVFRHSYTSNKSACLSLRGTHTPGPCGLHSCPMVHVIYYMF
jgi:hypothetical protein